MENSTVNIREILTNIRKHVFRVIVILLFCLAGGGAYLYFTLPIYESEALLQIKQAQGLGASIMNDTASNIATSAGVARKERMSTYAEILKSRDVIEPIIKDVIKPDKNGKYPNYDTFIGRISTTPVKDTEILKVSVSSTDPDNAKDINEKVVQQFLVRLTELSHSEKKATKDFLEGRVAEADENLTNAENRLQEYQVQEQIISPNEHMHALIDRMTGIKKEDEENKVNLAAAQAKLSSVNGQLMDSGVSIADNEKIKQYNSKLADMEITRVGYLSQYTEAHPKMIEINKQIQETRTALESEISRVANMEAPSDNPVQQGLLADKFRSEAEISIAQSKAKALNGINSRAENELTAMPAKEQGFVRAQRDVNVAQDIYTMLYKRLEEAKIAEVMVQNEVQVIDKPTLPERPVKPSKRSVLMLAALLGLSLGLASVVIPTLLHRRINTVEDVARYMGLEVLGSIADLESLEKNKRKTEKWYVRLWVKICRK